MQADKTIVVESIDEAICLTLAQLVEKGTRIVVGDSLSIAAGRATYEILNYSIRVTDPRRRFPGNREFRFSAIAAVSRFVWMMAGSDRVSDIAFYQPGAAAFSDDNLTIPGSSYGRRVLSPRPGLNQLAGVIERLKEDPHSRRAFLSIYQPEDAVRLSKDIPCVLTLGYHIRDHRLYATTSMRANNAYSLFAYNFFEFSLLAEIIAAELGVELGPLTHSAVSMHVYEEEVDHSRAVVRALPSIDHPCCVDLPPQPLAGIHKLIELEPVIRSLGDCSSNGLGRALAQADHELHGAWRDMFQILLIHGLHVSNRAVEANDLIENLREPWRRYFSVSV
jgi:thymidylate synthase